MGAAPVAVELELNPNDLRSFLAALKRFEPKLATATRRNLRRAGDATIAEMRDTIESLPVQRNYGVRSAIGAAIALKVMTSTRSNGIKITVSGGSLGQRAALVKAFNKASFRHPLFGNRDHWFDQPGRPYFGEVLKRNRAELVQAIEKALEEAVAAVNAG